MTTSDELDQTITLLGAYAEFRNNSNSVT